jgi:hypothetical protein
MKNPHEIKAAILAAFAAAGILVDNRMTGTSREDAENRRIFIVLFMSQCPKLGALKATSRLIPDLIAASRGDVYYGHQKHKHDLQFYPPYKKKFWAVEEQFLRLI